ncbi:MAG TPA: insecticidal delta-endotoxin Cry8Ea1 family protein [Nitrososphaera sp.]|nr:insecticidal delta-endotoxin Cry8Ea1 family protein [Nitrososphaera sp.]
MAELFYLFDDVQVVAGDLLFIEPEPVPYTTVVAPPRAALKASFNASSIGKGLASGLVSGIGGKIGGLIFEAIFPPGVPDYFDEVYKEIGKIVKSELTQSTIDQINGRINGVVAWAKNTYKPRKEAGTPRDELLNMVSGQVNLLYTEAAYTLMEPRYAKSGVTVFMVAAGVHLGLMQEQALVDPRQPDPGKSSYAISVKLNAQTYADHLVKTFDALVNDRKNLVDIAYDPIVFDNPPPKDRYRFHDKLTDTRGNIHEQYMDKDKKNHTGEEEAEADRQNYLPGVVNKLTNDLGNPGNTASQWLKLTTKPIP